MVKILIRKDYWPDDPDDDDPAICRNCGCYGNVDPEHPGEYVCPRCGDFWDIYKPPPDVP